MAPMEPPKAEVISREALEAAVADLGAPELKEMAARLAKSSAGVEDMLEDLKAEQQALKEENAYLNETITLMMKEMQKLNIGRDNTIEPMLVDDNKLAFVGRLWEKVKPRDTAYTINENVGEIKKPEPGQQATPTPQEVGRQVVQNAQKNVQSTVQNVRGALGPLWSRAESLVKETHEKVQQNLSERAAAREAAQAKQQGAKGSKEPRSSKKREAAAASSEQGQVAPTADASQDGATAAASSSSAAPVAQAAAPTAPAAEESAVAAGSSSPGGSKEQSSSTILIEARLKIDDGSVQTLHVRAADRCKEVARRFVQEHSLKAWFEEPLTAWLKKTESDAVKFPVVIEGDLMDIRKTFAKAK